MKCSFQPFLPVFGAALLLSGCATVGPPLPASLDLPKPPSDLRATRKGDSVNLSWTIPALTTDRQRARSFGATRICRSIGAELTQCGAAVGEVRVAPPSYNTSSGKKPSAEYRDVLPSQLISDDASAFAVYAVEVRNADGRSAGLSNQVRVPLLRTLAPPRDFAAQVTKEGVALSWSNQSESDKSLHHVCRVYRRLEGDAQWILVGQLPVTAERMTLTDSNIEWEKTYVYRAEIVTVFAAKGAEEQVDGDDSPELKVWAHDIFPPAVPSSVQAVFSGPGQKPFIDLIWAPVPDVDLDGYNVYRHEEGSPPVKLNAALVKTPAYRDADVGSGKHYFYSVSAVDVRGNESARSEEAEESVP